MVAAAGLEPETNASGLVIARASRASTDDTAAGAAGMSRFAIPMAAAAPTIAIVIVSIFRRATARGRRVIRALVMGFLQRRDIAADVEDIPVTTPPGR